MDGDVMVEEGECDFEEGVEKWRERETNTHF